jgi:selenocysteine lyase/cysteine desulfurase/LmbE family N-acetylglucosaminyl deacetylase
MGATGTRLDELRAELTAEPGAAGSAPRPPVRVLGVFAHPDDETFCAGGVLARQAKAGAEVMVVSATHGEAGQIRDSRVATRQTIGAVRESELRQACDRLGVASVECWDHTDGTLAEVDFDALVGRVAKVIRTFRPDIVLTFGPDGGYGHPDHMTISRATTQACARAGDATCYPEQLDDEVSPHRPRTLFHSYFPDRHLMLMDRLADWLTGMPERFTGTTDFVHALLLLVQEAGTMRHVSDHAQVHWYPAGADVVEQGEVARELFVILSGTAEAWQEEADGSRRQLRVMGPGEFFGELGIAGQTPRSAYVVARESLTCLALSREAPTAYAGRGADARLTDSGSGSGPSTGHGPRRGGRAGDESGKSPLAAASAILDVDVAAEVGAKVDALCAYRSQFPIEPDMFPDSVMAEIFGHECFIAVPLPDSTTELQPDPSRTRPRGLEIDEGAYAAALADFQRSHPDFVGTAVLDDLRRREYARLDAAGLTYLDYTGAGVYAASQIRDHEALLEDGVFGNPHSGSVPSAGMTERVEATRARVLEFFGASPEEYEVIFTPNATGALRLVGEAYPFDAGDQFLLTFDNHNSVNGIREFAWTKQAEVNYVAVDAGDMRVPADSAEPTFASTSTSAPGAETALVGRLVDGLRRARPGGTNLFAYPAQSNFSGVQHPLEWIDQAKAAGWDVLLDAAAFVPTNRLDLSRYHPDYVSLSFYKIFGYPTGIGALLVRHEALAKLHRPWYAGGNIVFSSVRAAREAGSGYYRMPGAAGFEDGTLNYLDIMGVDIGLRHISAIGVDTIHTRVTCLTDWLLQSVASLRHTNGSPVVRVYGPGDTHLRGATVAMNFFDPEGSLVDSRQVEQIANGAGNALRSGCHCNPGAREVSIGLSEEEMADAFRNKDRLNLEEFVQIIDGKTTGAVRASLGLASTFADVYRFSQFARTFIDRPLADLVRPVTA